MIPKPKDSGTRQTFNTGSVRDTPKGKGRYDLLPTRALEFIAVHFENGAEKYGDRNWEKGQPLSRYIDSAARHLFKHLRGLRDEPHATAAAWNILCLIETERLIEEGRLPKELNDLPKLDAVIPEARRHTADVSNLEPRPPLGLMPRWLHEETRLEALREAIERYAAIGQTIPEEWISERAELLTIIQSRPRPETAFEACPFCSGRMEEHETGEGQIIKCSECGAGARINEPGAYKTCSLS